MRILNRTNSPCLNPGIKLHHTRPSEWLALKWGRFSTQDGNIIFQWIEDWEDSQKNVIRYALMYRSKKIVPAEMCDLYVVSLYSTAEAIRKFNEALRELNLRKEER